MLDAPPVRIQKKDSTEDLLLPDGVRDRAIFGMLAFTGCRVGELTRLKVDSYKQKACIRFLKSSARAETNGWCH